MRRALALLLAGGWIGAAGPGAAAEYKGLLDCTVDDVPVNGRLATCTGRVSPNMPYWTWVVRGQAPNRVTSIEIYEHEKTEPRQVLRGFTARPALVPGDRRDKGSIALILQDVNFDREADLRIALGPPGDIGVRYRWWLFDKAKGEFVATDLLDAVLSPIVNVRRKSIIGAGKDDKGRALQVLYKWRNDRLDPSAAQARGRDEAGNCIVTHYISKNGKFEKKMVTDCKATNEEFE